MYADHLREWLREHRVAEAATEAGTETEGETSGSEEMESATKEGTSDRGEERETTKWVNVVELVQLAFRNGVITEEAACQSVVLIPKGGGDYRGMASWR